MSACNPINTQQNTIHKLKTETLEMLERLRNLGVSYDDALAIRRISMTLSRWDELCCGNGNDYSSWAIERDEETDKPYMVIHQHNGKSYRRKIADREKGAEKRLAKIMERYAHLVSYHQGDPRGASVYIIPRVEIDGKDVNAYYNRGVAVFA